MKLSPEEVAIVRKQVDQSSIRLDSLRDDVLDHLCCVVEIKIERGGVFDTALQEALRELAPDGLDEIQRETVFLLNSTKVIRMKQVMYLIGLVSAISMSLGWMFRILHWPGGTALTIYGALAFSLLFLPMLIINHFKVKINSALSEKLKLGTGFLSALIYCSAFAFKLMHLPGADQLIILATLLFSFGFLPFLFFTMYKKSVS
jgi:hypothetical protein